MMGYAIDEKDLHNGGELFEMFWLRPKLYKDQTTVIRLRINKKWGGWKLKDELVDMLGLEVGNTISTEVTPFFITGKIDDVDDMDLFASDAGADWLLENDVKIGTIIDCRVRFSYCKAPVGANGKDINKASLIFEEGLNVVGIDDNYIQSGKNGIASIDELLRYLQG